MESGRTYFISFFYYWTFLVIIWNKLVVLWNILINRRKSINSALETPSKMDRQGFHFSGLY